MINLTQQRIGIYYKNRLWGEECFNHIVAQIPKEMIAKLVNNKNEKYCTMINGDVIRLVAANDSARGYKFTSAIVQGDVTRRILENIIYPCVKSPVAIVDKVEDIVPGYVTIKQELPRQEIKKKEDKKKFIKIKVRY